MMTYGDDFYESQRDGSLASANIVVPLVLQMLRPSSVLDVGCGVGTWLSVFKEEGIDVFGVDGDYVNRENLLIDPLYFSAADLTRTLDLDRHFDLVISLEVAEHIAASAADIFVRSLVRHADLVLFSAAVPGQGGDLHVNEQWPSYWVKKFRQQGFEVCDPFREAIWDDQRVAFWYRQNLFLAGKPHRLAELNLAPDRIRSLVHPQLYEIALAQLPPTAEMARVVVRRIGRRIKHWT